MKTNKFHFAIIYIITIAILFSGSVYAENVDETLVDSGNSAYNKGEYENAIKYYEQILSSGYESPELYYNMGNSYFKLNDIANSVYYYEKALRLNPGNEDIQYNLKVAYNRTADKIESLPDVFYIRWWNGIKNLMSSNSWAMLSIIFVFCFVTMGGLFLLGRQGIYRKIGFWSGLLLLIFSIFSFIFSFGQASKINDKDEGIIFDNTIVVKSSPDVNGTDLFVLHEGTKVFIKDEVNGWYEVKIGNGSTGWLPKESIREI